MYVYVLVRLVSILCASTKKPTVLQLFASFTQPLDRKKIDGPGSFLLACSFVQSRCWNTVP